MDKLPFLLSIPHGGRDIPDFLQSRILLDQESILEDGDLYTDRIYNLPQMEKIIIQNIARIAVDMNRKPDDLPPKNNDGVVKTKSCDGRDVYAGPLSEAEIGKIITEVYKPYHRQIEKAVEEQDFLFGFDCHSMLPLSPLRDGSHQSKRPLINLGNFDGRSCSFKDIHVFGRCLSRSFGIPEESVSINYPFRGGWIIQKYGNKPIPWVQIELNRNLYYGRNTVLFSNETPIERRIDILQEYLNHSFQEFHRYLSS